jgi:hypothetical protein
MSNYTEFRADVNSAPTVGHNSGNIHPLDDQQAAIAEFVERIKAKRRLDDALTAADFIAMDSSGKLSTMKKVRLDMLVRLHALDPKLAVEASIAVLIVDLSDNEYGRSFITIARLAHLLSRDVSTIQRAVTRLAEEFQVVIRERPSTGSARRNNYRPHIPRVLADQSTTLKSVMDAYAPADEPKKGGRPRKLSAYLADIADNKNYQGYAARMVSETTGDTLPVSLVYQEKLPGADEKPTGRLLPGTEESLKGISKEVKITTVEFVERGCGGEAASSQKLPARPKKVSPRVNHPDQIDLEEAIAHAKALEAAEVVEVQTSPAKPPKSDRATSLPENWALTPEWWDRSLSTWDIDDYGLKRQERRFYGYWRGIAGTAKGRKTNWPATWINWMDRDHNRRGEPKLRTHTSSKSMGVADVAASLWGNQSD